MQTLSVAAARGKTDLRVSGLLQAPSGKLDHFLPLSDFTYSSMRDALLAEYSAALSLQEAPTGVCQDRQSCAQAKRTIDILVTAGQRDCRCQSQCPLQVTIRSVNEPTLHHRSSIWTDHSSGLSFAFSMLLEISTPPFLEAPAACPVAVCEDT